MEVDNENFWPKLKTILFEALGKTEEKPTEETAQVELEEEKPTETPVEEPKAEEKPSEEIKVEEPKTEPTVEEKKEESTESKKEEVKDDNHLEELINNLKSEIEALKEVNSGLQNKIKDLGKTPSTKPVSTTAKPSGSATGTTSSTYQAWREQMRSYLA